jgi:hypothetical protein
MTHEHDPEHPLVTATLQRAQRVVQQVATVLQADGWDAIVISLSRAVQIAPGEFRAPGATATVIDPTICAPIIPQIVEVLRKQAAALEANAPREEATSGYIHDQSNYASGLREWPK